MKKIIYAFCAIIGLVLFSCSDDEPATSVYEGPVDKEYIMKLVDGTVAGSFKGVCGEMQCKEETKNKWVTLDSYEVDFVHFDLDTYLYIKNGLYWDPVTRSVNYYNTDIFTAESFSYMWELYCSQSGFDKQLYIVGKINYEERNNTIEIYGHRYIVTRAEEHTLGLKRVMPESLDGTMSNDSWYVGRFLFSRSADFLFNMNPEKIVTFDTKQEAALWKITKIRERYGDKYLYAVYDGVEYYRDLVEIENAIHNGDLY